MLRKIIGCCLLCISLTACFEDEQKEYSIDEVTAAWEKDGEHAPLVEEVHAACRKTADKGKLSPACTVYNVAQSRIFSKEFLNKIKKNNTN